MGSRPAADRVLPSRLRGKLRETRESESRKVNTLRPIKNPIVRWSSIAAILSLMICRAGAADPAPSPPVLLQWQQTYTRDAKGADTTTPAYFASHLEFIDTLPFDGTVFNHALSFQIMHSVPVDEPALAGGFASLAKVKPVRFVNNFALVNVRRAADFFGDWSVPIANFRAMARVCRDAGLRGIMFDNEEYSNQFDTVNGGTFSVHVWNWPDDVSDATKTLADYHTQARLRGRQVMEAMAQEYPGITVIAAHSAAESDPTINWWFGCPAEKRELMGAFVAGLVEGSIADGQVVDGGEWNYTSRSPDDFEVAYEYPKHWLPSAWVNCAYLPLGLRSEWAGRTSIAFGLYNLPYRGQAMNPAIMRNCVALALRRCDAFVFQYTEGMAWFEPGRVGQEWKDAIAGGRADAASAGRLTDTTYGFDDVGDGVGVALDGVHGGIDFGSGKWVIDASGSQGRFAGAAATSGTFVLPAGRWLKSVRLCADSAVEVTVGDDSGPMRGNPIRKVMLAPDVTYTLVTGWTYPGRTVAVRVHAAGHRVVVDDVRYLSTLPAASSPASNVRRAP